jgi:hypothetical protein
LPGAVVDVLITSLQMMVKPEGGKSPIKKSSFDTCPGA